MIRSLCFEKYCRGLLVSLRRQVLKLTVKFSWSADVKARKRGAENIPNVVIGESSFWPHALCVS